MNPPKSTFRQLEINSITMKKISLAFPLVSISFYSNAQDDEVSTVGKILPFLVVAGIIIIILIVRKKK